MKPARARARLLAIAFAVAVPSLALAFASSPDASERIESLLRSIEAPPTPERLDEAAGPGGAGELLRELASAEETNPHARWQAIGALAHYPGSGTEAQLREIIDQGRAVRAGAATLNARAAAFALAQLKRKHAVPAIAPLLDHVVPDVRADAARALATTGAAESLPALRRRLQVETSPLVRAEIVDAIRIVTP